MYILYFSIICFVLEMVYHFYIVWKDRKDNEKRRQEEEERNKLNKWLNEKFENRKVRFDSWFGEYGSEFVFIDLNCVIWQIDYWDNQIFYDKTNKPFKNELTLKQRAMM